MTSTKHPSDWAQESRSINQAFAVRELAIQQQLSNAAAELERLRLRCNELVEQNQYLSDQLVSAERSSAEALLITARQVAAADSELGGLQHQCRELEDRARSLSDQLQAASSEGQMLRDRELHLLSTLDKALTASTVAQQLQERRHDEAQALSGTVHALESELACARLENAELRRDAAHLESRTREMQQLRDTLEAKLSEDRQNFRVELAASQAELRELDEQRHQEIVQAQEFLAAKLETELREQLVAEQLHSEAQRAALEAAQRELSSLRGSIVFRLRRLWGTTAAQETEYPNPKSPSAARRRRTAIPNAVAAERAGALQSLSSRESNNHPRTPHIAMDHIPPNEPSPIAETIVELLSLHDKSFVVSAYRMLLGREPDPSGFKNYLEQVRSGTPKRHIVAEIGGSAEGLEHNPDLPGLREIILQDRPRSRSWLGWVFRRMASEANTPIEVQLRIVENRLGALADEWSTRTKRLDVAWSDVRSTVIRLHAETARSIESLSEDLRRHSQRGDQPHTGATALHGLTKAAPGRHGGRDETPPIGVDHLIANALAEASRIRDAEPSARGVAAP